MNVRELRTVGVRSYQLNGLGTGKKEIPKCCIKVVLRICMEMCF